MKAYFTDLGGCIFPDYLDEACVILAGKYHISPANVDLAKRELWSKYAFWPGGERKSADDSKYSHFEIQAWAKFAACARIDIAPDELIAATSQCARPLDTNYETLLERLQSQGVILGVISNNTHFWWQRQREALRLERFFHPDHVILSCDYGVSKRSPGLELFNAALASVDVAPDSCLFADDRVHNIEFALCAGFAAAILHPQNVTWGAEYVGRILTQAGLLPAACNRPEHNPRL